MKNRHSLFSRYLVLWIYGDSIARYIGVGHHLAIHSVHLLQLSGDDHLPLGPPVAHTEHVHHDYHHDERAYATPYKHELLFLVKSHSLAHQDTGLLSRWNSKKGKVKNWTKCIYGWISVNPEY